MHSLIVTIIVTKVIVLFRVPAVVGRVPKRRKYITCSKSKQFVGKMVKNKR